jgi:D-3-phosphoglycerate dehydrogenase
MIFTPKVYIVDDVSPILNVGLTKQGFEVIYEPHVSKFQLLENLKIYQPDVLVLRSKIKIDEQVLYACQSLKLIARAGAGMDNINLELAKQYGIECINAGEANSDAVGDHTLGLLLNGLRNISKSDIEVKKGIWLREENRGIELSHKTVGVIGYGNTGRAVAKRLVGFGCKVLVYDKFLKGFGNELYLESEMERIFEEADVLTLHIPLTDETNAMVDSNYLSAFKKSIFLMNLSRGPIVKTSALIEALENNKVYKCALDVLENEDLMNLTPAQKKEFQFLAESDKVILTPHIGGWTLESYDKISAVLLKKIIEINEK